MESNQLMFLSHINVSLSLSRRSINIFFKEIIKSTLISHSFENQHNVLESFRVAAKMEE